MTDRYCDLGSVKGRLNITNTIDDVKLNQMINSVSRTIDAITQRRFHASTETRVYQTQDAYMVDVDDLLSVTTLKTGFNSSSDYDDTWAATDYVLAPVNGPLDGWPYFEIRVHPYGTMLFPQTEYTPQSIQVVGSFGFSATVPDQVIEAALLGCQQVFKRKDAIFGVMGPTGFLQQVKWMMAGDPQISMMLSQYVKRY